MSTMSKIHPCSSVEDLDLKLRRINHASICLAKA